MRDIQNKYLYIFFAVLGVSLIGLMLFGALVGFGSSEREMGAPVVDMQKLAKPEAAKNVVNEAKPTDEYFEGKRVYVTKINGKDFKFVEPDGMKLPTGDNFFDKFFLNMSKEVFKEYENAQFFHSFANYNEFNDFESKCTNIIDCKEIKEFTQKLKESVYYSAVLAVNQINFGERDGYIANYLNGVSQKNGAEIIYSDPSTIYFTDDMTTCVSGATIIMGFGVNSSVCYHWSIDGFHEYGYNNIKNYFSIIKKLNSQKPIFPKKRY